ncbi:methyltransferase type 12 [Haloprofundus marisrubri]|uniref:Methyltransferase type 12 n=1 Tax=Haloprofundus marisrubri TaxID=1514971 RepID=A0A0W1R5J5_9EURY|nr:class I SAM-dependent methyltransferase [Haloprofundus marisrubri]KTG08659.1 methyltransferase type 12 [Haloprofundus marisrubri]
MDDSLTANRDYWDELAAHHPTTDFYDVQGFLDGQSTLFDLERGELGGVVGERLLHLQCHFGLDTLSWAREGAEVTGVDFSETAIETARELRDEVGIDELDAQFVESDVYDLDLGERFDTVFTSYGVLAWLPDLDGWADVIDRHLKPGGRFYIAEIHPFGAMFGTVVRTEAGEPTDIDGDPADYVGTLAWPYHSDGALSVPVDDGSYADGDIETAVESVEEWTHGLGEVVTALSDVGLRIEFLHEFEKACYQQCPSMVEGDDGWWRFESGDDAPDVPLTFSLLATKPE